MGGIQSSKRRIRRNKITKCQSFEHFLQRTKRSSKSAPNFNISVDEDLEQVLVSFKMTVVQGGARISPLKSLDSQCKARSDTTISESVTKRRRRQLKSLRGCRSSSQLQDSYAASSCMDQDSAMNSSFACSVESLTDVTSMFTVESVSDISIDSNAYDLLTKCKLQAAISPSNRGTLSRSITTHSHSTCSGSSALTAHGESLMRSRDQATIETSASPTKPVQGASDARPDLRPDARALTSLITRSCVDMSNSGRKKVLKSCYSSEDSGFLDEESTASISHISSCSNISSLDEDTPSSKSNRKLPFKTSSVILSRRHNWWKKQLSRASNSTSSLTSKKAEKSCFILDSPNAKKCDYFKSELTGNVLSFKSNSNRLNIRHLASSKQTSILVSALENFLFSKFRISSEHMGVVSRWLRDTDNNLLQQGWQESLFISEQALVFIFLLANDTGPGCEVLHIRDLRKLIMTWSFVTYSYIGTEITYPITNFLLGESVDSFFRRCLFASMHNSSLMLLLSQNKSYAASMYEGLLNYSQLL